MTINGYAAGSMNLGVTNAAVEDGSVGDDE